ncbi:hypothetical protein PAXRUDRAFT_827971 [Paxillus rubicundulus Ve08.2h10]|uniref:Unplaced genomic scaffold scaffold_283, whole genome shotgun sequence n=1 Tax=Paxillus rubicundulus Ve08.2h10 TaxID=930991 RepID=A0A0D0E801_9AGAM|nr:hypothetical protein PAXRUDRAFT_827971 [Paxillus rubicundulus Ve08.2h10]
MVMIVAILLMKFALICSALTCSVDEPITIPPRSSRLTTRPHSLATPIKELSITVRTHGGSTIVGLIATSICVSII